MQPLGLTVPIAQWFFIGLLIVFAASEYVIRVRSAINRSGAKREWKSLFVVLIGLGGGIGGAIVIAEKVTTTAIGFARVEFFVVGIVVMAAGIAFRIWSVVTLGRYFTVQVQVRDDQAVVDTGPYRYLRHPSYTGLLAICLGIGLALDNWLALIVAVVLPTAALVIRIRVEERVLLAGIGEPYARFAATRSRLIPHVW